MESSFKYTFFLGNNTLYSTFEELAPKEKMHFENGIENLIGKVIEDLYSHTRDNINSTGLSFVNDSDLIRRDYSIYNSSFNIYNQLRNYEQEYKIKTIDLISGWQEGSYKIPSTDISNWISLYNCSKNLF